MSEILLAVLGGSTGAAFIAGVWALIQYKVKRADEKSDKDDSERKALRYLMLYIIQERAKQHIKNESITLEERRSLHHWHKVYHDGLGGNGDADLLMEQVDALPLAE